MSQKSWGIEFIITNDIVQRLDPKVFQGGSWTHLATVTRGFKEYMAFRKDNNSEIYIEEIDNKGSALLKKIEDDQEWGDLMAFLIEAGILTLTAGSEIKLAKDYLFPA